jgi:hypothetical protein
MYKCRKCSNQFWDGTVLTKCPKDEPDCPIMSHQVPSQEQVNHPGVLAAEVGRLRGVIRDAAEALAPFIESQESPPMELLQQLHDTLKKGEETARVSEPPSPSPG